MTEIWEPGLLFLAESGSTSYGTNTVDSDLDFMGVAIPPKEYVLGLQGWEQSISNTAIKGERSTHGDTDKTIYSLQKFVRITAAGNPNTLPILFSSHWETMTELGAKLVNHRNLFVTREAGRKFLGYMKSQRDAMTGARNKRTNRPELIHKYGVDTKFAYHLIRLGFMGIDLMEYHLVRLPMSPEQVRLLLDIRNGKLTKEQILELSVGMEDDLVRAIENSDLPERAQADTVDQLLIELHEEYWAHGNWVV